MKKLPPPPAASAVEARITSLDLLAPAFKQQVDEIFRIMHAAGLDPIVWETLRTSARQLYLFGFGRDYDDGRGVVTNVQSAAVGLHIYGLAVDIVSKSKMWGAPAIFWDTLKAASKMVGAYHGSMFKKADLPHVQFGGTSALRLDFKPDAEMRRLLAAEGRKAVWKYCHADRAIAFPVQVSTTGIVDLPTLV